MTNTLRPGSTAVHQPSGLPVEVLRIGDSGALVRFPKGAEISILFENLTWEEQPSVSGE